MSRSEAATEEMPSPGKPPHGQKPVARSTSGKWHEEDQLSLQLAISPDESEAKSVKGRRSKPSGGGREKRGGPPILKAIRKEAGLGLKVLTRVQKLFPGDPLRQVGEFFADFVIPAATEAHSRHQDRGDLCCTDEGDGPAVERTEYAIAESG